MRRQLWKLATITAIFACMSTNTIAHDTELLNDEQDSYGMSTEVQESAPRYESKIVTRQEVQRHLDQLITNTDKGNHLGIKIINMRDSSVLYEHNSDRNYVPASNQKIYTDAAALLYFGPDYQFKTLLLTDAKQVQGQTLEGNLYIKLSGDPTLTTDGLRNLLSKLREYGIRRITGDVVIDTSVFEDKPYGPGSSPSDSHFAYGAGKTPLILDQNNYSIIVSPASQAGLLATVEMNPANPYVHIKNGLTTVDSPKDCVIDFQMQDDLTIMARGCIGTGYKSAVKKLAISRPLQYAKALSKQMLVNQQVQLMGTVRQGKAPDTTKELGFVHSSPLSTIVADTLRVSNNVLADAVFLKIGAEYSGKMGTWQNSAQAVTEILQQQTGMPFIRTRISDGSGLSRYNTTSPAEMVHLLDHMYHNFPVAFEFIGALPKSGFDGSLYKRMQDRYYAGWVRAKTGTLIGVTSLSGYIATGDQQVLAFSMMSNGVQGGLKPYRHLEDDICKYLSSVVLTEGRMPDTRLTLSQLRWNPISKYIPRFAYQANQIKQKYLDVQEMLIRARTRKSGIHIVRETKDMNILVNELAVFNPNTSTIHPDYTSKLQGISRYIQTNKNPLVTIEVFKHATPAEDQLARARADALSAFLVNNGVEQSKILRIDATNSAQSVSPHFMRMIVTT